MQHYVFLSLTSDNSPVLKNDCYQDCGYQQLGRHCVPFNTGQHTVSVLLCALNVVYIPDRTGKWLVCLQAAAKQWLLRR